MKRFLLLSLALTLAACATPPAAGWVPTTRPRRLSIADLSIADLSSADLARGIMATVGLRTLRVSHGQADRWAGPERGALRFALLSNLRARAILDTVVKTQRSRPPPNAPRVTVFLGQEACLEVKMQHTYVRDYVVSSHGKPSLEPVLGGFETGLTCRVRVNASEDASWAEALRTWIHLSGDLEIATLTEVESTPVEHSGSTGAIEHPKIVIRRHPVEAYLQEDVVALLAPPVGPGSESQLLVLLRVSLTDIRPSQKRRLGGAAAAPRGE
ncbi:MAG: hypothetical protein JKY65_17980 [Planctomycetes bacterium]|nr:hypothetical protein [Planctomycetota bacterium]